MQRIFINGRFLTQRQTGVQRFAFETLCALDSLLSEAPGLLPGRPSVVVLAPYGTPSPDLRAIRFRAVGPFAGNAWEQLTLPLICGRSLLVGFTTTGPLLKSTQVITMHDAAVFAVPHTYTRAFRAWYRLALPVLARRSLQMVTVSQFSKSELIRYLGRAASSAVVADEGWQHVLRDGSDSGVLSRHGLQPGAYVLAVGSVTPHKNLAVVARAASLVSEDLGLKFVVAGPVDTAVFNVGGRHGANLLNLVGYVSAGELRALYENAAVFVHPSKYEGFGIPPLEAMALGCPVIASNAAAIPEVCGDAAWYFSPDDADALAAQITTLAAHPEQRAALVARGRLQIQRHSWRETANRYLQVIGALLDRSQDDSTTQMMERTASPSL